MNEYHKIQTVFKRDLSVRPNYVIEGEYSLPEFKFLRNCEWVFTEKIDGTNIRVMFDGEDISFGGRTEMAQIPAILVNALNETFLPKVDIFRDNFPDGVCLYGEGYGAKIQKSGENYRPDNGFIMFDVRVGKWWLNRVDVEGIGAMLGISCVPIIGRGTLDYMVGLVKDGLRSQWGDFFAEGIVARPMVELFSRGGSRIITKLKHRDFKHD